MNSRANESRAGQGLVEYLILVCLVAVSAIAIVSVVGKNIKEQYANISAALRNGKKVELTEPARSPTMHVVWMIFWKVPRLQNELFKRAKLD